MQIAAIIVAAGASRRLGEPKQLVRAWGTTLLEHTIAAALAVDVSLVVVAPVIVVLGAAADTILAHLEASAEHGSGKGRFVPVVNPRWEQGISSSIRVGVEACRRLHSEAAIEPEIKPEMEPERELENELDGILILACDQPLLSPGILRALLAAFVANPHLIVSSHYAGTHGVPAIFPPQYFGQLVALEGDEGARSVIRKAAGEGVDGRGRMIGVPFAGGSFDIDTPADLERLLRARDGH